MLGTIFNILESFQFQFILIGLLLGLLLIVFTRVRIIWVKILLVISLSLILAFTLLIHAFSQNTVSMGGPDSRLNRFIILFITYYPVMFSGLVISYLLPIFNETAKKRREMMIKMEKEGVAWPTIKKELKKHGLHIDLFQLWIPFFGSIITFVALFTIIKPGFSGSNLIIAFQTGFCWESIVKSFRTKAVDK